MFRWILGASRVMPVCQIWRKTFKAIGMTLSVALGRRNWAFLQFVANAVTVELRAE